MSSESRACSKCAYYVSQEAQCRRHAPAVGTADAIPPGYWCGDFESFEAAKLQAVLRDLRFNADRELLRKTDIREVVAAYARLDGERGDCPFCSTEGALEASSEKQLFYCHACLEGGDVVTFVRSLKSVGRREAIAFLRMLDRAKESA